MSFFASTLRLKQNCAMALLMSAFCCGAAAQSAPAEQSSAPQSNQRQPQTAGQPAAPGQRVWRTGPAGEGAERRFNAAQLGSERFMGPIVSKSGDSLVVLRSDTGARATVKAAADARVLKDQNLGARLSDFAVGDYVVIAGDAKDGVVEAKLLASNSEQSKQLRESLGKTMVIGRVLAVDLDAATMKVRRVDGEEQTLQADENSSFKRGRDESITMADVKVGDQIGARGALKDGNFVISQLNLMPRGMMMGGGGMRLRDGEQNSKQPAEQRQK